MPRSASRLFVTERVRLGIAGFGRVVERSYAPALKALDSFDVRVVAEPLPSRRIAAQRAFPAAALADDAEQACADVSVDAWMVALPPAQHYRVAAAALRRSRHVYVEKPLTLDPKQAFELVALARTSGAVAVTGYVERFVPSYAELRRRLSGLAAGPITDVHSELTFDEVTTVPWKQVVATGGGALNDIAVHHADLLRFLFATEITEVRALAWTERRPSDSARLDLRLENGVRAHCFCSSARPSENRLRLTGPGVAWTVARFEPRSRFTRLGARLAGRARGLLQQRPDAAFVSFFDAFARAIRHGQPMRPDLEDGARGVAFLEAAQASARLGGWVRLRALGDFSP